MSERQPQSPVRDEDLRSWSPKLVPLSVGTGVLTVLSFPLFGARIGLDQLIWVALVPLIAAC